MGFTKKTAGTKPVIKVLLRHIGTSKRVKVTCGVSR
jgi:hypothetical protein